MPSEFTSCGPCGAIGPEDMSNGQPTVDVAVTSLNDSDGAMLSLDDSIGVETVGRNLDLSGAMAILKPVKGEFVQSRAEACAIPSK